MRRVALTSLLQQRRWIQLNRVGQTEREPNDLLAY
jgi:hypothetical protein